MDQNCVKSRTENLEEECCLPPTQVSYLFRDSCFSKYPAGKSPLSLSFSGCFSSGRPGSSLISALMICHLKNAFWLFFFYFHSNWKVPCICVWKELIIFQFRLSLKSYFREVCLVSSECCFFSLLLNFPVLRPVFKNNGLLSIKLSLFLCTSSQVILFMRLLKQLKLSFPLLLL